MKLRLLQILRQASRKEGGRKRRGRKKRRRDIIINIKCLTSNVNGLNDERNDFNTVAIEISLGPSRHTVLLAGGIHN